MSKILQPAMQIAISNKYEHPNADRLEVLTIAGFKTVVQKNLYKIGEQIQFFEPGTCFTEVEAERLNITSYLRKRTDRYGNNVLVIYEVKLRGIISEGLILPQRLEVESFKFEPPCKTTQADGTAELISFPQYGSLDNLKKDPGAIPLGAEVTITEKIHGTNSRVGFITLADGTMELVAGSRTVNRKRPGPDQSSLYWLPFEKYPQILEMFKYLKEIGITNATLYGELYGPTIQSYGYGLTNQQIGYCAFTLKTNSRVLPWENFNELVSKIYGIPCAPLLANAKYSYELIEQMSNGPSELAPSAKHGREGVVIQHGTHIYKFVGSDYLLGKGQKNETTDI